MELVADGSMDFLGGQDASRTPDRIPPNSYAAGVNVSTNKGTIAPRWGYEKINLRFPDEYVLDPFRKKRSYKNIFETSKFQAMVSFYIGQHQHLIIVIAGHIFAVDPMSYEVVHIPIDDGSMINTRASRVNWSTAGKYLIFYDFPAYPVIVEGLSARRASSRDMEIPAATMGAFNQNRLFIANNGYDFTGGDPAGSTFTPNAPITFEEVMTPGSPYYGQIFQLPSSDHNDPITYMGFLQVTDTSTGNGPLLIGTDRAIYSYAAQKPRSDWEQGVFGNIICYNAGIAGPRAFVNVNSDAFFLSRDGWVRSLAVSRDEQKSWARLPMSKEVENWFLLRDPDLLQFSFISYFKNKIFFSVNPYRVAVTDYDTLWPITDYTHGGFVVMEVDTLSSYGQPSKPVWVGLWTGIRPMDMVTIDDRAFVIAKDGDKLNSLYEINPDITHDTRDNKIKPIRSKIYTKEYNFENPFFNKELHSLDINVEGLKGDFKLDVKYKPSHGVCFLNWGVFEHTATWQTCDMPEDCFLNGYAPHQIRDFTLGAPEEESYSPITDDPYKTFKRIQLLLTLEGDYWEIHELRIKAVMGAQSEVSTIYSTYPSVDLCKCCQDDWR